MDIVKSMSRGSVFAEPDIRASRCEMGGLMPSPGGCFATALALTAALEAAGIVADAAAANIGEALAVEAGVAAEQAAATAPAAAAPAAAAAAPAAAAATAAAAAANDVEFAQALATQGAILTVGGPIP